jgi:hypothetical protein
MSDEMVNMADICGVSMIRSAGHTDSIGLSGYYEVKCFSSDNIPKWEDVIYNIVTTVGKNGILDSYLGNVNAGAFVMGLKGVGTAIAADTQASHASWLEVGGTNAPTYSGNRPVPALSAAVAGVKATSAPLAFSMTSSGTVAGCFINVGGSATKDSTTGTLFSAGDFTAGSRAVVSGDTLLVTYSATAA